MLNVITPNEAKEIVMRTFSGIRVNVENVPINGAINRILGEDIHSSEDVPGFTRSMVDGYAVRSQDTFGCSSAMPAILCKVKPVEMGNPFLDDIHIGQCAYVPTGGQLPSGSDAMVMIEYTEDYGDGTIGILKPAAPGLHCIFRGDDTKAGQSVLQAGKRLLAHDIGTLAAMGIANVPVRKRPVVGILSTGDELTTIEVVPGEGQVRDVNSHLLGAAVTSSGGEPRYYGICCDNPGMLKGAVSEVAADCDVVLLSGGTSVGEKDAAPKIVESLGRLLFHGLAMRPGKPTLCGQISGKPVFCLPGHPVSAYFVFRILVSDLIYSMMGATPDLEATYRARLAANIPSNHGREEYIAVHLKKEGDNLAASPVMGKSGLISLLSNASGYIIIARDKEGVMEGDFVDVFPFD